MHQTLSAYACGLGMKRRAVAGYLASVVVDGDPETFVGVTSRPRLEDQIVPDDAQRFQIGSAPGALPFLLEAALLFGGIGAGSGPVLSLGHAASKPIRYD